MAEILTESFCERCGTRYTFEAATPKKHRIGRLKVLSKGLRNYVLSDDASLDEALAEARSEEEREASGGQLDAFHEAFQFCMSCRQYTCANCWNEAEGRCLTCAPLSVVAGQLRSPLDDLLARGGMAPLVPAPDEVAARGADGNGHATREEPALPPIAASPWPTIDLFGTAALELAAAPADEAAASTEPVGEAPAAAVDPWLQAADALPVQGPPDASGPAELDVQVPAAAEATPPAPEVAAEPSADFWTRPFTGFAPLPEPTNGHVPAEAVAHEPAPAEAAPAESVIAEPGPDDQRAAELAERTTRLLGRFRVQARSAAATPEAQPLESPRVDTVPAVTTQTPAVIPPKATETAGTRAEPPGGPGPATPSERGWPIAATPDTAAAATTAAAAESPTPLEPDPAEIEPSPAEVAAISVEAAPPVTPRSDRVEMPAWPVPARPPLSDSAPIPSQPPLPSVDVKPAPIAPIAPFQAPQWPAPLRPEVDASTTPFWASGDAGRAAREADLWNASAREVAGPSGQVESHAVIQSCVSCGLSLSSTARFCRRCGSRQG